MKKLTILEWAWIVLEFLSIVALLIQLFYTLKVNGWFDTYSIAFPPTLAIACLGWYVAWKNKYKYELVLFILIALVSASYLVFQFYITYLFCNLSLILFDRIITPITLFCFAVWYAIFWILRVRKIKENEK